MPQNSQELNEEVLNQAIDFLEQGAVVPEILAKFPNESEELKQLLTLAKELKDAGRLAAPKKELLEKILARAGNGKQTAVTREADFRYVKQEAPNKGRASTLSNFTNLMDFMSSKVKVLAPLMAVVLLVIIVGLGRNARKNQKAQPVSSGQPSAGQQTSAPSSGTGAGGQGAAGGIDEILNAISQDNLNEQALAAEAEADAQAVTQDSDLIQSLSEESNENF